MNTFSHKHARSYATDTFSSIKRMAVMAPITSRPLNSFIVESFGLFVVNWKTLQEVLKLKHISFLTPICVQLTCENYKVWLERFGDLLSEQQIVRAFFSMIFCHLSRSLLRVWK